MLLFEVVIALLLVGGVLSLWAGRLGIPYPALLALAGAALALIPGVPEVALDPELALALFVAPVLLDAAFDASPRDLRDNLAAVSSLALGAVIFTIAGVAWAARLVVPDMSWAAAITLGAIVAPPDAAAAIAVLRRVRPPHRLLVILEGESLFNDATALLIYRIAATAAVTGAFSLWTVGPMLLLTCGGGAALGLLLARLYMPLAVRVRDIPISILMQFISTFGVWILADRLGVSAIITVVAYAMSVSRRVPALIGARHRIASYAVWEVTVFVLNVLAFVLIGLQLRGIVTRMEPSDWRVYGLCALAVCVAVILTRVIWMMSHNTIVRWRIRRHGAQLPQPMMLPSIGGGLILSWCGMRGIVSLATALALPNDPAHAFPYRDLILLCSFAVVLTTLIVQGLTLRWLIERVGVKDDGVVQREVGLARAETARVALRTLDGSESPTGASVQMLKQEYEARRRSGERLTEKARAGHVIESVGVSGIGAPAASEPSSQPASGVAALQREAVNAQRRALMDLRARDVIGDAAFQAVEEELDLLELTADPRVRPG